MAWTASTTFIIGPIARLLGLLMNGIFIVLDKIGIPNIGLAIIIFTIIIYMALMPLTVRQQKFSKLQQKMQPELAKIQAKYKNRKDQESMMRMNEEQQALYQKYGVSPMGSCLQLLIQMPILFALYRVIYNIPAYVGTVKDAFFPLVSNLMQLDGATDYLQSTSAAAQFSKEFASENFVNGVAATVQNVYIDVLNRFSTADWTALGNAFESLSGDIHNTVAQLERYNDFLGLNIGNSPWFTLQNAWSSKSVLGIIAALSVPLLAAVTQLINVALMPMANSSTGDAQQDQMMSSMKTMNYTMPLMSAFFCFTLPAGMGLYWIAGSVIRSAQQVFINKSVDKMDMDAFLKKQEEKNRKKAEKRGDKPTAYDRMMQYSQMNTKNGQTLSGEEAPRRQTLSEKAGYQNRGSKGAAESSVNTQNRPQYRKGSLSEKANMVAEYNSVSRKSASNKSEKKD
jgi:YidC/Oxa1 family membrane protein insertase